MIETWEADNESAQDDEKSQVSCKPLINNIAAKLTDLSMTWKSYYDLLQLVKTDCGRSEGEYYYWYW